MPQKPESETAKSVIPGPDGIDATPLFSHPIGDHTVKAVINIQYALERSKSIF